MKSLWFQAGPFSIIYFQSESLYVFVPPFFHCNRLKSIKKIADYIIYIPFFPSNIPQFQHNYSRRNCIDVLLQLQSTILHWPSKSESYQSMFDTALKIGLSLFAANIKFARGSVSFSSTRRIIVWNDLLSCNQRSNGGYWSVDYMSEKRSTRSYWLSLNLPNL